MVNVIEKCENLELDKSKRIERESPSRIIHQEPFLSE
jgi:hypothetical protein